MTENEMRDLDEQFRAETEQPSQQAQETPKQPASAPLPENVAAMTPEQQAALVDALWTKLYDEKTAAPALPVDLDKLTDAQLIELGKQAFWKAQDRADAVDAAKQARIAELRAEIARLEGKAQATEEPPAESPIERFVNAAGRAPDPNDDSYPWFKMFGSTRIRPFEKHLLGEASLIVGQLAYQGIINLIPPKPLNGYEASDNLCDAIRQISGALWLVKEDLRLSELAPEKRGEYDVDDDPLDVDKFAEPDSEGEAE